MTKPRNFKLGYPYHITGRGNKKEKLFLRPSDYKYCIRLLHKYSAFFEVPLIQYCLMPNHYHLVVQCTEINHIPRMMHMINSTYSFHLRRRYGWTGHVFQGNYHSWKIGDLAYFNTVIIYVMRNPVIANLSQSFEEHPWSYLDEKLVRKMTLAYEFLL
jgi:putative transposase